MDLPKRWILEVGSCWVDTPGRARIRNQIFATRVYLVTIILKPFPFLCVDSVELR
jgi:hypothetical protein